MFDILWYFGYGIEYKINVNYISLKGSSFNVLSTIAVMNHNLVAHADLVTRLLIHGFHVSKVFFNS